MIMVATVHKAVRVLNPHIVLDVPTPNLHTRVIAIVVLSVVHGTVFLACSRLGWLGTKKWKKRKINNHSPSNLLEHEQPSDPVYEEIPFSEPISIEPNQAYGYL